MNRRGMRKSARPNKTEGPTAKLSDLLHEPARPEVPKASLSKRAHCFLSSSSSSSSICAFLMSAKASTVALFCGSGCPAL